FGRGADCRVWDVAGLLSAAAFRGNDGRMTDSRLVLGAAACVPWRLRAIESALVDRVRDEASAAAVATLETAKARTLNFNGFKLPLMENLIRRAVRGEA